MNLISLVTNIFAFIGVVSTLATVVLVMAIVLMRRSEV